MRRALLLALACALASFTHSAQVLRSTTAPASALTRHSPEECRLFLREQGYLQIGLSAADQASVKLLAEQIRAANRTQLFDRFEEDVVDRYASQTDSHGRSSLRVRAEVDPEGPEFKSLNTLLTSVFCVAMDLPTLWHGRTLHTYMLEEMATPGGHHRFQQTACQEFHHEPFLSHFGDLQIQFSVPIRGDRSLLLFPRSHLSAAGDFANDPIEVVTPEFDLLVWYSTLFHAGTASDSNDWRIAYHGYFRHGPADDNTLGHPGAISWMNFGEEPEPPEVQEMLKREAIPTRPAASSEQLFPRLTNEEMEAFMKARTDASSQENENQDGGYSDSPHPLWFDHTG